MGFIKKSLIFVVFLLQAVYPIEFYINSGREGGQNFAVLSIVDDKPFICKEELNRNSEVGLITCEFDVKLVSRFSKSDSLFFNISPQIDNNKFILNITPKKKMKLFSLEFDINSSTPIPQERNESSSRWQIIGYEDSLPFLDDRIDDGLNFPISFSSQVGYPKVGPLDYKMEPMSDNVGLDKDHFLKIQSFMSRKSYNEALLAIDEMSALYPNSIFKRDVLYLKILALDGVSSNEDVEDVIDLAKMWLDAYPTDINVPEVLYVIAKSYAKMQFFDEAFYYYNRLFKEYKGDKFELLARLEYGKNLYARGDRNVVLDMYESVLEETQDIHIASLASFLLAEFYKNTGDKNRAQEYLLNILQANPNYYLDSIDIYYPIMQDWAEEGIYEAPAEIVEAMLDVVDKERPIYIDMLKDVAMWYDNAQKLELAHKYYKILLGLDFNADEKAKIKKLDDELLLKYDEDNATKRLEHYDYVMQEYKGQEEEQKALERKVETLYELKKYKEVFDMRDSLESNNTMLLESVGELTKDSIKREDCKEAAFYGSLYSDTIPLDYDDKLALFDCLYKSQQYKPAQNIAQLESEKAKLKEEREDWLYRLGWVMYKLQDYPKASMASRDVVIISNNEKYNDAVFVLFMSLVHQNRKEEAFSYLPKLEDKLKDKREMIEVYRIMLLDSLDKKDDTAITIYANKLIALQDKYSSYDYSPWVELSLVEALNRDSKFAESLEVINKAIPHAANNNQKVQVYYLQGYLNSKLNKTNEAYKSYSECEGIQGESPWKTLCIDAKNLILRDNPNLDSNTTQENNDIQG